MVVRETLCSVLEASWVLGLPSDTGKVLCLHALPASLCMAMDLQPQFLANLDIEYVVVLNR